MRWQGRRQSGNVEDRRGGGAGRLAAGGGIGTVIIAILYMLMGGNPADVIPAGGPQPGRQAPAANSPEAQQQKEFVSVVLADTEDVWNRLFREAGGTYREPRLVLFSGRVESACGMATAAVGPFYCPEDAQVYLDTSFFDELGSRFGAQGDFAQAYVIAHEVGHHVQNQLGIMDKVNSRRRRMSEAEANELSVRLELQADFFAGVWAHHAQRMKKILDPDDLNEALRAANAIGDDRLQAQSQGYVVPDSFTHGTSEQRVRWFRRGWETGDLRAGDTFGAPNL